MANLFSKEEKGKRKGKSECGMEIRRKGEWKGRLRKWREDGKAKKDEWKRYK
jgi:hypothetical protein